VVVVTVYGSEHLSHCLETLEIQVGVPEDMEIIAVGQERLGNAEYMKIRFPFVKFIFCSGRPTQDTLRAYGVSQARGKVVAITVDHCNPERDWCMNIAKAHEGRYAAVGGAIEMGTQPDTLVNRAVHLYDYCNYAYYQNPMPSGSVRDLSDCNVSYKRSVLAATADLWRDRFNVSSLNKTLLSRGELLWFSPNIVVRQNKSSELGQAARLAYRRGQAFSSSRLACSTSRQRIFYIFFSPFLPLMFWKRLMVNLYQKSLLRSSLRVLPLIGLFAILWSWGEFTGYLAGRADVTLAISDE
jgi:hypothetical protein